MHPGPYNAPPGAYPPPGYGGPPGLYGHNVPSPRYGHPGGGSKRGGCSCTKICCCCCCFLFIHLVLLLFATIVAYYIIDPKAPIFTIDGFASNSFGFTLDGGLKSELQASVKAVNPNNYLEFVFGEANDPKDNSFKIYYENLEISSGAFPILSLPPNNVKTLQMNVTGELKKESFAGSSGESLAEKLKNNDKIPLTTVAMIPIKFEISGHEIYKDTRIVVNVNTSMNVKNLAKGNVEVSDSKTDVALHLNEYVYLIKSSRFEIL